MPISPAPWILDGLHEDEDGKHYRVLSQGRLVAKVYDGETGFANARLIVGAPETRNALECVQQGVCTPDSQFVADALARSSEI